MNHSSRRRSLSDNRKRRGCQNFFGTIRSWRFGSFELLASQQSISQPIRHLPTVKVAQGTFFGLFRLQPKPWLRAKACDSVDSGCCRPLGLQSCGSHGSLGPSRLSSCHIAEPASSPEPNFNLSLQPQAFHQLLHRLPALSPQPFFRGTTNDDPILRWLLSLLARSFLPRISPLAIPRPTVDNTRVATNVAKVEEPVMPVRCEWSTFL